jgi:hypothetical protein
VEDQTPRVSGRSPGADVDAIGLRKSNGGELFASSVEDSRIGNPGSNEFADVSALLGPPDSNCEVRNFTALGGQAEGGYVIVSFGDGDADAVIEDGDTLRVYEVGATLCGRYDDDPYRVSVSVSTALGDFIELGDGGNGSNDVPVRGLP